MDGICDGEFMTNPNIRKTYNIAGAGNTLYADKSPGALTAITANIYCNTSTRFIQSTEYYQKLYMADYEDAKTGTDVTGFPGTDGTFNTNTRQLSCAAGGDWTTLAIDPYNQVCFIYDSDDGTVDGVYEISSISAGYLVLSGAVVTPGGDHSCSYRVIAGPKYYDPKLDVVGYWTATAGYGTVPVGCTLLCKYRDRLVLAGDRYAPQLWYMSRIGDPLDWDYSQQDSAGAVAGNATDTGSIGQPITALAPFSDDYLIFGCERSLWILRGDPRSGGRMDNVSYVVGIIDGGAWCYGPSGEIVFLSHDGVYSLAVGSGSVPTSVSREQLPRDLQGIDLNRYRIVMQYDSNDRGVHIFVIPISFLDTAYQYWMDWGTASFWPVLHNVSHHSTSILINQSSDQNLKSVIFGCRDGYIRQYSNTQETDDSVNFESYALYGPILLADQVTDGLLLELIGTLGLDSNPLTWEVYVNETGQGAADAAILGTTPFITGTWIAGQNYSVRPRVRGRYMVLKVKGLSHRLWVIEDIMAQFEGLGKSRRP
jgi:hypothetical protein